ncbi:unnamed protein product [Ilex paraguariensis]|uniref:NAC domain-containing protein n=1 Tax=Ilex paraguariensis TaxID=185542 RepID=A0ABC8RQ52_9AQUA
MMDSDQYLIQQLNNNFIKRPVLIDGLIIANLNDYNPSDFFPEQPNSGIMKGCYVLMPRRPSNGIICTPAQPGYRHKTNWKMIEYRLLQHYCSIECNHMKGGLQRDDWVLGKVYEDFDPEALSSQMGTMDIH